MNICNFSYENILFKHTSQFICCHLVIINAIFFTDSGIISFYFLLKNQSFTRSQFDFHLSLFKRAVWGFFNTTDDFLLWSFLTLVCFYFNLLSLITQNHDNTLLKPLHVVKDLQSLLKSKLDALSSFYRFTAGWTLQMHMSWNRYWGLMKFIQCR